MTTYTFDTIEQFIGRELGLSAWMTIDQTRIDAFAAATGDFQWIHTNPQKASESPLGSTVAHGYLTLSLLPALLSEVRIIPDDVAYVLNYGADKVRFINFVKVNSKVRVRSELLSVTQKSGGYLIKTRNTMEIEGEDKPAMVAETLALAYPK